MHHAETTDGNVIEYMASHRALPSAYIEKVKMPLQKEMKHELQAIEQCCEEMIQAVNSRREIKMIEADALDLDQLKKR